MHRRDALSRRLAQALLELRGCRPALGDVGVRLLTFVSLAALLSLGGCGRQLLDGLMARAADSAEGRFASESLDLLFAGEDQLLLERIPPEANATQRFSRSCERPCRLDHRSIPR